MYHSESPNSLRFVSVRVGDAGRKNHCSLGLDINPGCRSPDGVWGRGWHILAMVRRTLGSKCGTINMYFKI